MEKEWDAQRGRVVEGINSLALKMEDKQLSAIYALMQSVVSAQEREQKKQAIAETVAATDGSVDNYLEMGKLRKKRTCPLKVLAAAWGMCKETIIKLLKEFQKSQKQKKKDSTDIRETLETEGIFKAVEALDPNKNLYSAWYQQSLLPVKEELAQAKRMSQELQLSLDRALSQENALKLALKAKDEMLDKHKSQLDSKEWLIYWSRDLVVMLNYLSEQINTVEVATERQENLTLKTGLNNLFNFQQRSQQRLSKLLSETTKKIATVIGIEVEPSLASPGELGVLVV